jgi:hypothetical protein
MCICMNSIYKVRGHVEQQVHRNTLNKLYVCVFILYIYMYVIVVYEVRGHVEQQARKNNQTDVMKVDMMYT